MGMLSWQRLNILLHKLAKRGSKLVNAKNDLYQPSRSSFLRANLRARRIASAFWRAFFSDGFSKCCLSFISRNTPSLCSLFSRPEGLDLHCYREH